ncbi:MAG TPA: YIEGIA family protein [Bacillota bacterium]|nr:YIEGIA family protein [Bacillota bacterium]
MPRTEHIILVGLIMGTLARFVLLKVDFRQYPSYPQGYIIHLTLGAIAAGLGAVILPALLNKDYTAVTFLTIAIQQFREVRRMERDSLDNLEVNELVKRGSAYIEDISKKFEARNYAALLVSISATLAIYITQNIFIGIIAGIIFIAVFSYTMKGKKLMDVAGIEPAKLHFKGAFLLVDDIVIMNIGLEPSRDKVLDKGVGILITPKDHSAKVTLTNTGQRQAMLYDVVSILGVRRDVDEPEYTPMARRNPDTGTVGLFLMTSEIDVRGIIEVVKRTPVLETCKKQPIDSFAGKRLLGK